MTIFKKQLVAVFHNGRSLPNLDEREHSYLTFIGTAYADKTAPIVSSTRTYILAISKINLHDAPKSRNAELSSMILASNSYCMVTCTLS